MDSNLLKDLKVSTLCEARHDIERCFVGYYHHAAGNHEQIERVSRSMKLLDSILQEEIERQEATGD